VVDDGILAVIGAAIVGFGIVAFVFRVQRELERVPKERWIPWADRLLISSVLVALLLVLFPIALAGTVSSLWGGRLPAAACSASTIALAGYIPALLAHYRFRPRPQRDRRPGSHSVKSGDRPDAEDDQDANLPKKWIWFGPPLRGKLQAGQPAEKAIVVVSAVLGVIAAAGSFVVTG
jgi:hypothetical protein